MKSMPQEIEVWYLIPALRRELAKIFISEFNMTQKQISQLLYITESAVSQYLKSKRGNELKFSEEELNLIKKTAERIHDLNEDTNENLYKLCVALRGCESVCNYHKKQDCTIASDCDLCIENHSLPVIISEQ